MSAVEKISSESDQKAIRWTQYELTSNLTHCDICITELHLDLFEIHRYNYPNRFVVEPTNQVNRVSHIGWLNALLCRKINKDLRNTIDLYSQMFIKQKPFNHLLSLLKRCWTFIPRSNWMHSFGYWYYTSRRQLKHWNIVNM